MRWPRHALAWSWLMVVLLVGAHNGWVWLYQRASPDTDILALLPSTRHDALMQQAFVHMVDSAQQKVVVLLGDADWNRARRAADAYAAVLQPHATLVAVANGAPDALPQQWLRAFDAHRSVLLTDAQRTQLETVSAAQWSRQALAGMYGAFNGPRVGAWIDDPFDLFSGWVQQRAQQTPVRTRDGHLFIEREGRAYALLLLELRSPALSMHTQRALSAVLRQAHAQAMALLPDGQILSAGMVLHAAAASDQASGEMALIGTGSLLGILLLMWVSLRSFKPIAYIATSIAVGCLGALSVSWLWFGQVHLLTLVFGASLIGVAQDYAIYFLCARLGAPATLASRQLLRRLLPGLALMLGAALIGYLAMAGLPFPGLQQMALFSATGLVFAWLTVVCWFPALVSADTVHASPLLRRCLRGSGSWPRLTSRQGWHLKGAAVVSVIGLGISGLARLTVSDDIRALQNTPPALMQQQLRVGKMLDMAAPVQFYLVRGDSAEQVLQIEEQLREKLQPLIDQRVIGGIQAVSTWVPSQRTQRANLALLEQALMQPRDGQPAAIEQIAAAIGEDASWVAAMRARVHMRARLLTPATLLATPAAAAWHHLWLPRATGAASIVALRGLSDYRQLPRLAAVAQTMDGVQWVDKAADISAVLKHYRQTMSWALAAAYGAVWLLLALRYRRHAWRAIAPPLLATLMTLALLGWSGQPLQLFHVLAALLILGLGVDYGIFLLEPSQSQRRFVWLAVALSAISALLSFGLLAASASPPLHAFGLTMAVGMLLVWLLAPCLLVSNRSCLPS